MRKNIQNSILLALVIGLTACTTINDPKRRGATCGDEGVRTAGLGEEGYYSDGEGAYADGTAGLKRCTLNVENQTYYFDFDSNVIHEADIPSVDVQGSYLATHPNAKIRLEGHTDPRGSREYNVALGERRANSVAEVLKMDGASPSQIRVVSYGAEKLASTGHTEEDYQLDRRVVLVYEAK